MGTYYDMSGTDERAVYTGLNESRVMPNYGYQTTNNNVRRASAGAQSHREEHLYEEVTPSVHGETSEQSDGRNSANQPGATFSTYTPYVDNYTYPGDTIRRNNVSQAHENGGYDAPRDRGDLLDYENQAISNNDVTSKIRLFKISPREYITQFESKQGEMRSDEEAFIIGHLLKKTESDSPVREGNLEHLAMFGSCESPRVVKRALHALLNEIFLSISDVWRFRCNMLLKAEEVLRTSFPRFLSVDHENAKCQRMTTYAWLIILIFLKSSKDELFGLTPVIKGFDKTLENLENDRANCEHNTFRYGIYLARETIKRIVQSDGRKDLRKTLLDNLKKCEYCLSSRLEKNEVMKLGKAFSNTGSWLDLHVCLVFLQDLPKLHQFQDSKKPIILMQMLIADFRQKSNAKTIKRVLKLPTYEWQFEILVYHVMLRLIRTSRSKPLIEQVLNGEQGCGGILRNWIEVKSGATKGELAAFTFKHTEKLCQRAAFVATPEDLQRFIANNNYNNEEGFIEDLSKIHLSWKYKDKVFEVSSESRQQLLHRIITYDGTMAGKKCVLKLHEHSKEEVLKKEKLKSVPLRKEIEIVRVLNALKEPCANIVHLLEASVEPPMHMLIETTPKDDLLTYLRSISISMTAKQLLQMAMDVCNAMIYLGRQNIIHRDLSASNCFVFTQDGKLLIKLGDFRLAIPAYSSPKSAENMGRGRIVSISRREDFHTQFAVRWMAVEALQHQEFSTASDVWSYGVLVFEIFTFGSQPYINMPNGISLQSDREVRAFVVQGQRLELHPMIPEPIQTLIRLTMVEADHRPTFLGLENTLQEICFEDDMLINPAFFELSNSEEPDNIPQQPNSRTGCIATGCFGECLRASDTAEPWSLPDDSSSTFTKEFVPAIITDVLSIPKPTSVDSLAEINCTMIHTERIELITEVGDLGNLEGFISEYGCPVESAIEYVIKVGEALTFLHSRRFIHRNVRAASVFVYTNGNVKLACLARARKLMPDPNGQLLAKPINLPMLDDSLRWSSPEVITDGMYSTASDAWAFGVLMWEIFSLIDKECNDSDCEISYLPYHQLSSKHQILSYLRRGKRLGKPVSCPDWLHNMMVKYWEDDVHDRLKPEAMQYVTVVDNDQCF